MQEYPGQSRVVDMFVGIDRHIEDASSKFAGNIL